MGNSVLCGSEPSRENSTIHWNENIDRPVPSGETLLTIACHDVHQLDLLRQLLKEGANVNKKNHNGSSPLHVAIREMNEEAVDILLEHYVDVNTRDTSGLTPLHVACVEQNKTLVLKLLKAGSNPDGVLDRKYYVSTPLISATESKNVEICEMLIEKGAQVNQRDWWQNTALLKAVQCGSQELVQLLLSHGAEPSVCNRFGGSALHYATIADYCDISRMLVEAGCDLRQHVNTEKDSTNRYSPLAAAIHRDCESCFEYFLSKGADINEEDPKRKTPLVYALTNRAWDCHNSHYRYVPRCFHGVNPPTIDATRLSYATELITRGAKLYPVWDYVIWQIRHRFLQPEDEPAINLCIMAMGFVHQEGFKVETLFRTLALSHKTESLWYLYMAGFAPSSEDANIALNFRELTRNVTESSKCPQLSEWLPNTNLIPRTLKNLAVVKLREHLPVNVMYSVGRLKLPRMLSQLVTLEAPSL